MPEPPAPAPKLPVLRIIHGAFALPWAHRGEVLRATGIPLLVIIGCTVTGTHLLAADPWVRWVVWGLYFVATAWLAIEVHRLVLLPMHAAQGFDSRGLKRLGIYAAVFFGIWILFAGVRLITFSGLLAMAGAQYV